MYDFSSADSRVLPTAIVAPEVGNNQILLQLVTVTSYFLSNGNCNETVSKSVTSYKIRPVNVTSYSYFF